MSTLGRLMRCERMRRLDRHRQLGDTEIAHLDDVDWAAFVVGAAQDEDVFGLEIAVDDADVVRFGQRGERLRGDLRNALIFEGPLRLHDGEKVVGFDELHHEIEELFVLAEIEHAQRVGVLEPRRRKSLES